MSSSFTIRARWFLIMGVLASAVVIASIVVAVLVARFHMYAVAAEEAKARAQAFAYRAGFAVLVGADDRSTVDGLLKEIMQGGAAKGVQLVRADGELLGTRESEPGMFSKCGYGHPRANASVIGTLRAWCVSIPVIIGESVSGSQTIVGELRIVSSTDSVRRIVHRMAVWLVIVGIALLSLAWIVIWRSASGVTRSLVDVARTMQKFGPVRYAPRASVEGPQEIRTIATVYNGLIDDIRRHEAHMEDQVMQRTRELNDALARIRNAERYKSTFMATVSHEMKTPIYVIDAHARDVLNELEFVAGGGTARSHIEVILRESEELTERLSQILELSRAEWTHDQLAIVEIDLAAFGREIQEKAEPLARRQRNTLEFSISPGSVAGDRDVLGQIVMNLVTNACKFTEQGIVRVRMVNAEGQLEIDVVDSGRGISKHTLSMIFDEFWQADSSEGRRVGGFGLGLAIVKRCVERLRGTVSVESQLGAGTQVHVRIPHPVVEG